jgi:hypothetical protein
VSRSSALIYRAVCGLVLSTMALWAVKGVLAPDLAWWVVNGALDLVGARRGYNGYNALIYEFDKSARGLGVSGVCLRCLLSGCGVF